MLAAFALLSGCSSTQVRTAKDTAGKPLALSGTVVLIEPDIELSELGAGGMAEPRKEWTDAARKLYPQAARDALARQGIGMAPDYYLPADAGPETRARQLYLLAQAVSSSILTYERGSATGRLRNKHGKFDWSVGPGVQALRETTGADYGLFTYIRDSYASGGRQAMRIAGLLLLGGDMGGGMQVGVASLIDLRTGQVVWHNLLIDQTGDMRNLAGARETADDLLKGVRGTQPVPAK
ncbi:hypothetical protein [Thermomonas sp. HDW16]|uniref:hypothetical protein n=1 Tax=Thermomonas sp. HDW16 TaxID=2714945 RepID=UPI00140B0622|nr:hypothetical protein [Thermomonas sp. HDW16]QIL21237.1 hypothetical protein G7079_11120 [Thermomonas sp. HDW16]